MSKPFRYSPDHFAIHFFPDCRGLRRAKYAPVPAPPDPGPEFRCCKFCERRMRRMASCG